MFPAVSVRAPEHSVDPGGIGRGMSHSVETKTSAPDVLRVEGLGVSYGALRALDDVSWSVRAGEVLGIIGPNGAGKSTCFEATTNMAPRVGRVHLDGEEVTDLPPWELPSRGLRRTFQQNVFFGDLSVLDNMTHALIRRHGTPLPAAFLAPRRQQRADAEAREAARGLLVRFGIEEQAFDMRPGSLPYGKQRMLSIALAHAGSARIILLDEPGAGLGGRDMQQLRAMLDRLRDEGIALVLVEHHMDLIMAIADQIVVLESGRVLSRGTPQEIRNDPLVLEAYLGRSE